MIRYFTNLTTGPKIFWIFLGCIFIFSICVAISTKGKEGGIAAGVITGLAVHFSVILENKGLMKWIRSSKEWYIIAAILAGMIVSMAIFAGILMVSVKANRNRGFFESFMAVLFRIIGAAGCVLILIFAFLQIGSGGVIYF